MDDLVLKGREQDQDKISMPEVPFTEKEQEAIDKAKKN